jgi:hypothetical protein
MAGNSTGPGGQNGGNTINAGAGGGGQSGTNVPTLGLGGSSETGSSGVAGFNINGTVSPQQAGPGGVGGHSIPLVLGGGGGGAGGASTNLGEGVNELIAGLGGGGGMFGGGGGAGGATLGSPNHSGGAGGPGAQGICIVDELP